MNDSYHHPVMPETVARYLITQPEATIVDLTCGGGGHMKFISSLLAKGATLIGIDRDPDAVLAAKKNLKSAAQKIKIVNSTFGRIDEVMDDLKITSIDGALLDLGVSSYQIDTNQRGFSFMSDGPLDMRMNPNQDLTAEDVINEYSQEKLASLFKEYGEEKKSVRVAMAIVKVRSKEKITSTGRLRQILEPVLSPKYMNASLARIFQAVRIEVNKELEQLREVLPKIIDLLSGGGRLVVIAYHSLEDRIVKRFFAQESRGCICPPSIPVCVCGHKPSIKVLTRKVLKPSEEEIMKNIRARSARLRAAEKLDVTQQ